MAGSAGSQSPDMQWVAVQGKPGQVNKTRAANELRDELMAGDWIKLHRKLTDSAVFTDSVLLHVWIFIITKANWKKRQLRNGTWIEAGELVTSRDRIAEVCKISPHQAYRRLKTLETLQQITLKAHSRGTHVKVLNWDTYQHDSEPSAQQAHSKRTQKKKGRRKEHFLKVFCRSQNTQKTHQRNEASTRKNLSSSGKCGHAAGATISGERSKNGSVQNREHWWLRSWPVLVPMPRARRAEATSARCRARGCMVTGGWMILRACTTNLLRYPTRCPNALRLTKKTASCSGSLQTAAGSSQQ